MSVRGADFARLLIRATKRSFVRLCRPDRRADRRPQWGNPASPDLRRGDGRLQLHLCRGDAGRRAAGSARTSERSPLGGVPAQLVPDNPKVGVDRANCYEPGLNRTYLDLATHYGTAILPARPRKPRDKAKVEVGVLVVERWILARLRNRRFFSLAELNRAIRRAGRRSQCASHAAPGRQPPRPVRRARLPGVEGAAGRTLRGRRMAGAGLVSIITSTSTGITTRCRTG